MNVTIYVGIVDVAIPLNKVIVEVANNSWTQAITPFGTNAFVGIALLIV